MPTKAPRTNISEVQRLLIALEWVKLNALFFCYFFKVQQNLSDQPGDSGEVCWLGNRSSLLEPPSNDSLQDLQVPAGSLINRVSFLTFNQVTLVNLNSDTPSDFSRVACSQWWGGWVSPGQGGAAANVLW